MSEGRTLQLACTGDIVLQDVLRDHIYRLSFSNTEHVLEETCMQISSKRVPLCQSDVQAATGWADLRELFETLAKVVEDHAQRKSLLMGASGNAGSSRLVRELLQQSILVLNACKTLMSLMYDTGFRREGDRHGDDEVNWQLDTITLILEDLANRYGATPLPVMAALSEGCFSGTLAALLHGLDVRQLESRVSLFNRVFKLIQVCGRLPDLAQLLAAKTGHQGRQLSVLGSLAALSENCKYFLDSSWRTGMEGPALEKQRKVAQNLVEIYCRLKVEYDAGKSLCMAPVEQPPEVFNRAQADQQLRSSHGASSATPSRQQQPSLYYPSASPFVSGYVGGAGDVAGMANGYGFQTSERRSSKLHHNLYDNPASISPDALYPLDPMNVYSRARVDDVHYQGEPLRTAAAPLGPASLTRNELPHRSSSTGLSMLYDVPTSTMSYPWQWATGAESQDTSQSRISQVQQRPNVQPNLSELAPSVTAATATLTTPGRYTGARPSHRVSATPSTTEHPSTMPNGYYNQMYEAALEEQQQWRHQQEMALAEAVDDRRGVGGGTTTGRHLGGCAAPTYPYSPARHAMPAPDVTSSMAGIRSFDPAAFSRGGQQAWLGPSGLMVVQPAAQVPPQQRALPAAAATVTTTRAVNNYISPVADAATTTGAAVAARVSRSGSVARSRPLASGGIASRPIEDGVAVAWADVPSEVPKRPFRPPSKSPSRMPSQPPSRPVAPKSFTRQPLGSSSNSRSSSAEDLSRSSRSRTPPPLQLHTYQTPSSTSSIPPASAATQTSKVAPASGRGTGSSQAPPPQSSTDTTATAAFQRDALSDATLLQRNDSAVLPTRLPRTNLLKSTDSFATATSTFNDGVSVSGATMQRRATVAPSSAATAPVAGDRSRSYATSLGRSATALTSPSAGAVSSRTCVSAVSADTDQMAAVEDEDDALLQAALVASRADVQGAAFSQTWVVDDALSLHAAAAESLPSSLAGRDERAPPPSPPMSSSSQTFPGKGRSSPMEPQRDDVHVLVSSRLELRTLIERLHDSDPMASAVLISIEDEFPLTRQVVGDGNCFYRAALFVILEYMLTAPDEVLWECLGAVIRKFLSHLEALQGSGGVHHNRAATAGRCPSDDCLLDADGALLRKAIRGGRLLLELLRDVWFKAPDCPKPSDVDSLELVMNHREMSDDAIQFVRCLTAHEMLTDEAFYSPFIPGCSGDYEGLTLREICSVHVLGMSRDVEQLQIMAFCRALGAILGVVDVEGSQMGLVKHGPEWAVGPPVAWVIHIPRHYEIVYPAKTMDVVRGGELVHA